jgi:erythromycin esterase-like protein
VRRELIVPPPALPTSCRPVDAAAPTAAAAAALATARLQRAIGVVHRPDTQRRSHYFMARVPDQFDAVAHFDVTRAVEPLDKLAAPAGGGEAGEADETWPTGL